MHDYTIGKNGLIAPELKREGDGCTPLGTYLLREVWYRADRVSRPKTQLPIHEITPDDGWCDDPEHSLYNQHFKLSTFASTLPKGESEPPRSFEHLWREDGAYDVIVVIGYNDAPAIAHKGSAIFIHCMHDDGRATAGCVAIDRVQLLEMIQPLTTQSCIEIGETFIRLHT